MGWWTAFAANALPAVNAGGNALGSIMSIGAGTRQVKHQRELNTDQMHKEMYLNELNKQAQLDIWQKTGPVGQMEQLKKAGLNPGLIYGMGGAGGQTAQAPQAHAGSGGSAGMDNSGQAIQAMGMSLQQMELMRAQAENLKADAELKRSQIPVGSTTAAKNTQDVATGKAQEQNILQQTANAKKQLEILGLESDIKQLQYWVDLNTNPQQITLVQQKVQEGENRIREAARNNRIGDANEATMIAQLKAEYAGVLIENALKSSNINVNDQHIKQSIAQINRLIQDNEQENQRLQISGASMTDEQRKHFNEQLEQHLRNTAMPAEAATKIAQAIGLGAVLKGKATHTPIGGFKPQQ